MNCDYEQVCPEKTKTAKYDALKEILAYGEEYCLFDYAKGKIIRKLDLHKLDSIIDTEEDWENFINSLNKIDILILYDVLSDEIKNPVIKNYRICTLKAYVYRLQKNQVETQIYFDANLFNLLTN